MKLQKTHVLKRTDILGRKIALCGTILNPNPLRPQAPRSKELCKVCKQRKEDKDAIKKINIQKSI